MEQGSPSFLSIKCLSGRLWVRAFSAEPRAWALMQGRSLTPPAPFPFLIPVTQRQPSASALAPDPAHGLSGALPGRPCEWGSSGTPTRPDVSQERH